MNRTNIPQTDLSKSEAILQRLAGHWEHLTPEAQKVARYVLDSPQEVGLSTVRELAEAAQVKPNSVVRMARQAGFQGYEDFRAPFREALRGASVAFEDRARWLQEVAKSGDLGGLYADLAGAAMRNIEDTFAGIDPVALQRAAQAIWNSRTTYVLGVGVNNGNARNFAYLASTGMMSFQPIPNAGTTAIDELAWSDARDVLVAMTIRPYRSEVVAAVRVAREQGVQVIAISDSAVSPIARLAQHSFVIATDTPQFFPSSVATIALLETLLSLVISVAPDKIVQRVKLFHRRRHAFGVYEDNNNE